MVLIYEIMNRTILFLGFAIILVVVLIDMDCSSLPGWQGNQALKQNIQLQQATMLPPIHQTMMG